MASVRCCQCNGSKARCTRCTCAKRNSPCVSCRPGPMDQCMNRTNVHALTNHTNGSSVEQSSNTLVPSPPLLSSSSSSPPLLPSPVVSSHDSTQPVEGYFLNESEQNEMMLSAYGSTMDTRSSTCTFQSHSEISLNQSWFLKWKSVIQLSGRHYDLPRGSCGRKYIGVLCDEIKHLAQRNYPSERVIVFSSVILQRDSLVKKSKVICCMLIRRLSLWCEGKSDLLIQEAIRCDRSFHRNAAHKLQNRNDSNIHITKVFTRLMLRGNIRAAVRWLTERSKGNVLLPTDSMKLKTGDSENSITVIDALKLKHPAPHPHILLHS